MEVSIIGTGNMATGIAHVFSIASHISKVNVIGRSEAKSILVKTKCSESFDKLTRKKKIDESAAMQAISKIECSSLLSDVQDSELIIEAISEDHSIKLGMFELLATYVNKSTIVATNTSSLSITAFANVLPYPENVVGLHFFNPAPVMELVEVIEGFQTSNTVVDKMVQLTKRLRKSPVVVQEAPGFVVNRMLIPMINEAICILAEGVATPIDIDKAMKLGAHHPMGPLALADLIGNDVNLSIMETLYSETGDSKYRPHPLLRKMVRANHLGRKTRRGFFEY
ncbi:MAG: 3-hydroxyacyl-CoA dehydrogenase NAD-binding domain-containing protein [Glaciecola sp.]|jgi:3-hydroxybutyryl-CoA dehydrogenase